MIQFIRRWGIFCLLVFSYISAYNLFYLSSSTINKRIELSAIHRFSGELLTLLFVIFLYQAFWEFVLGNKQRVKSNTFKGLIEPGRPLWPVVIDFLFYGFLLIICFSGLGIYFLRFLQVPVSKSLLYPFLFGHVIVGWFLLPVAILKYYRFLLKWVAELRHYLREY